MSILLTIRSLLSRQDFAEAIVGVPGEGLNVEQRKLLTIGVELGKYNKIGTTIPDLTDSC